MGDYELLNTPIRDSDYIPPSVTPSVPPDYLIQSGGGISNMHHGHPQGPYSTTAERSDIYGSSLPFPQSGFATPVRGGLYDSDGLSTMMGPRGCAECGMLNLPPYAITQGANIDYPYFGGPQVVYGSGTKKNFTEEPVVEGEDYTMIEPFNNKSVGNLTGVEVAESEKVKRNPFLSFVLLFLIFLTIDLWIQASNLVAKKYILKTENVSPKQLIIFTIVVTIILFLYTMWVGEPFIFFQKAKQQTEV